MLVDICQGSQGYKKNKQKNISVEKKQKNISVEKKLQMSGMLGCCCWWLITLLKIEQTRLILARIGGVGPLLNSHGIVEYSGTYYLALEIMWMMLERMNMLY